MGPATHVTYTLSTRPAMSAVDHLLLEEVLVHSRGCVGIEVGDLDGSGLFELTPGLEIFGDQRGPLISEFLFDVASDGSALVDDIAIIVLDEQNRDRSSVIKVS